MDSQLADVLKVVLPSLFSLIAAYLAYRAKMESSDAKSESRETKAHVVEIKEKTLPALVEDTRVIKDDVLRVEKATNSMKDALVKAEKASSLAEGKEIEKAEQAVRETAAEVSRKEGAQREQQDQALRDQMPGQIPGKDNT